MRGRRLGVALAVATFGVGVPAAVAVADDNPQPVNFAHNVVNAPAPVTGAVFGQGSSEKTGTAICTTARSSAANVNTDCELNVPHNETSIAVNPTNHKNMVGGLNDYQLQSNSGGHLSETVRSRAHVTFDGGKTWSTYPLFSNSAYQATGDPALAFDADGHAYYGTLGFRFTGPTAAQNPDVLVSNSGDGGRTWSVSRVAQGSGNSGSVGDLLDKEYVAAWGHGNAIVVYGDFRQAQKGAITTVQLYSSVTHNHGATWSTPQIISGSLTQAFGNAPVVASDGRIYDAFMNTDGPDARDHYYVVELSPTTGARVGGPVQVGLVFDGLHDSPFALGSPTYHDSVFRSWSYGNIAADPTDPAHLAVVFSDWRDGQIPSPSDPYQANTNGDVIVSQSFDRGRSWSAPQAVARAGDQWMPWSAYDASGRLRIGTFDRSYDSANLLYNYSLLSEASPGSLSFSATKVSTASSDPTKNDRWFAHQTFDPAFPLPTDFLGDYSNIAVIPGTTSVVAYWTDLRKQACFQGACGHGEDGFFARVG